MYGIIILLIGIFVFISSFASLIFNLLFNNKKITFYPFLVSIIICIVGGVMTLDYVSDFTYQDSLSNQYKTTTFNQEYMINGEPNILENYQKIENNDLKDNQIIVEVTYYDNYIKPVVEYNQENNNIHFGYYTVDHNIFEFNHQIIKDLKNKTIYNYDLLDDYQVKIYANSNTLINLK